MLLRARNFNFNFPRPTLVMGIVNVTPDSFSDGGRFLDPSTAVAHGLALIGQGADILDIGGESTRPGATPVAEDEELRRVLPVIRDLARQVQVPISVDTMKPGVAGAALDAGASIVNDVGANRDDEAMWRVVAETGAGYVAMHMRGTPQTMQSAPMYENVVDEVHRFLADRLERLSNCGVSGDQVIVDPGIGFGKTVEHNLQLLAGMRRLTDLGRPVLVGVSRKSFMGKLLGETVGDRLPAALACTSLAVEAGVQLIRTHDVAQTVQTVRMTEAILARKT